MMSDALQENTQRIQTKMERIRQTMIDYYSTLIWHEHRVSELVSVGRKFGKVLNR